jgi:glyoxylase-like metal-dependent hydrolase (beta-lactamase superfamily II)
MMGGDVYKPTNLSEFDDGAVLEIDGIVIQAIHTPGHTVGSAMYIYDDILFAGDAIAGDSDKERVQELPRGTYSQHSDNHGSVERVMDYDFERIADGHVGLHDGARTWIAEFLGE